MPYTIENIINEGRLQKFNDKFVKKIKWIDEDLYQELFSVCQSLSGPASTKLLYCINLFHGGTLNALLSFLIWSLPGAVGMYALSIGVSSIQDTLPGAVYALLSGLNAAIVGVIALAAVELSVKSNTDELTRLLNFFTATAGLLYNALWYFPVLITVCGIVTVINDYRWIHRPVRAIRGKLRRRTQTHREAAGTIRTDHEEPSVGIELQNPLRNTGNSTAASTPVIDPSDNTPSDGLRMVPQNRQLNISWQAGTIVITTFFIMFLTVMVLRGVLHNPPLLYRLFSNMFLAGTIIFGGGPVVIPLLREYVVAEGWVGARDFLIGLALIQAFPGPNFNFAVFLGSLTAVNASMNSASGAIIAWLGIFAPGLILVHGTMGVWSKLRSRPWVKSILRGINAGAVGLIYTAVYRIWQTGYIDQDFQAGHSLGDDPWWLVVAAASYFVGSWYRIPPALTIVGGAVMGLIRYGIVSGQ